MLNRLTDRERRHLARVKALPCSVCDAPGPSEAHHIVQGLQHLCVAVCSDCHRGRGGIHGDRSAWRLRKMDELADEDLPAPQPEQYNDLDLELKISTAYYNWVQAEKAPPEVELRYRDYIDLVTELLKAKMPAPAAAPGAAPNRPFTWNPQTGELE